jgi:hypothetical protein
MKRVNMLIKNKKEIIGQSLLCADITANDLESSGLSTSEKYHLYKWSEGLESGRHCMLALLDCRLKERNSSDAKKSQPSGGSKSQRSMEISMLSSTISLPDDFLCDSGYLYEKIFSKPPGAVVREALQMLADKAMEKTATTLRIDQINLALKQLRVENLTSSSKQPATTEKKKKATSASTSTSSKEEKSATDDDKEGRESEEADASNQHTKENRRVNSSKDAVNKPKQDGATPSTESAAVNQELESFRLQILIELIRMHILAYSASLRNNAAAAAAAVSNNPQQPLSDPKTGSANIFNFSTTPGKSGNAAGS